ncbi:hypothetical protein CRN67_08610 [Campylobacter blaseri]|uniref:Uncharacterized protein n=2 Tax=Campylobacter blaseri TaxID=2042961 RepID=A0A2P8QYH6_9BACT|nr:hypothetical protein CQ405_08605 [Campylobacter blaseri]PSM52426.1 hypothetical protein CRN67_08610 [Campylobacter blaseri]
MICYIEGLAFKEENAKENFLILKGFEEKKSDRARAIDTFESLYDMTKKSEYLKEAVQLSYMFRNDKIHELIKIEDKNLSKDTNYLRVKTAYFLDIGDNLKALEVAKKLVELEPVSRNYSFLALAQEKLGLYNDSLQSYKKSYELNPNENTLLDLSNIYIDKLNDEDSAIKELETYRKLKGCTANICVKLVDIYEKYSRYLEIIEIYKDLYEQTKNQVFLETIINFYLYTKDYQNAIDILKKYGNNNKLLVEIYGFIKDYDKAIDTAKNSYESTKDIEFLAMKAIYLYEKYESNISDEVLYEILLNFEKSANQLDNDVYQNYYGYLLIDYDINIKKGLELIEKAILKEPESPYYLDSLAWGYYKLNECEKANQIMQKINDEEFFNNKEGKLHMKAIEKCLKGKK